MPIAAGGGVYMPPGTGGRIGGNGATVPGTYDPVGCIGICGGITGGNPYMEGPGDNGGGGGGVLPPCNLLISIWKR